MMTRFFISFALGLLVLSTPAFGQQTIKKVKIIDLEMPGETASRAAVIDATGKVKSSTTTISELETIQGATGNIQNQIDLKVGKTGNESIDGTKNFIGKLKVTSTVDSSHPCPSMTDAEMLALSTMEDGDCVYNTTLDSWLVYSAADTLWQEVGSGGGISQWVTARDYATNDVIVESNKLYIALMDHTSGTFATDLSGGKWQMLNASVNLSLDATGVLPMANGGSNKNMAPVAGAVVYTDADSQEVTAAGTSGQVLQSNGTSAPTWSNRYIKTVDLDGSTNTTEFLKAPNYQLTQNAGTNTYTIETDNKNLLADPSFDSNSISSNWINANGVLSQDSALVDGTNSGRITLSSQSLQVCNTSTLYATELAGNQGFIRGWGKTTIDNIYLCHHKNGSIIATSDGTRITDCAKIDSTGLSNEKNLPIILGSISNGVCVVSLNPATAAAASVTGDVYLDDFKVAAGSVSGTTTLDTAWEDCGITGSDFTGFGTSVPTPSLQCKRDGSDLLIKGKFTAGTTPTAVEARMNLKFKGASLTSAGTSIIPSIQITGAGTTSGASATYFGLYSLIEPNVSYLTFGAQTSALSGISKMNGSVVGTGTVISFTARIPIAGWSANSDYYAASCGAACVDTFSAYVDAAGAVSNENIDWINGNGALSGGGNSITSLTYKTGIFTTTPNCVVSAENTTGYSAILNSVSSTQVSVRNFTTTVPTNTTGVFRIICQKSGADFVATRTIVGSFKEVVTAPGISRPKTCYYKFGGASATLASPTECTVGTCVETEDTCAAASPPTFGAADGVYLNLTFANGTFANSSSIYCECKGYDVSAGIASSRPCNPYFDTGDNTWVTTSNGGYVMNMHTQTTGGVAANSYVSVRCEGQAP